MSSELRVLFVINGLGTGGAERSLSETLPLLTAHGVDATVASLFRRKEGVESEVTAGRARVLFVDARGLPSRIRALREVIREQRPDLVHTTIFESDVAGRLAARGTGVRVLTSIVNTSYDRVRLQDPNVKAWKLRAGRMLDGWTARRYTSHFHAITNAVKRAAVRDLGVPPDLVTVIERGRDAGRLGTPSAWRRSEARRRLGLSSGAPVIVNVGRQEFQKGQRHLLEAVAQLRPSHPDVVLLLAGRRGHVSADLERAHRELGLGDTVRFLGHREDVPEVIAAADIFAFPSLYEGLGGAVIEAMALGLPIVAADIPALREVVELRRNALLVPPGEAEPLAGAIVELLASPELRARFGARSRVIFEERFTLERSVERMVALYGDLVSQPSRAHTQIQPSA